MGPAGSCSWRGWGAPGSANAVSQHLAAEVTAPLPRGDLQRAGWLYWALLQGWRKQLQPVPRGEPAGPGRSEGTH